MISAPYTKDAASKIACPGTGGRNGDSVEGIRCKVSGVKYGRRREYISKYVRIGSRFRFEREPDNAYDPNAIKVLLPVRNGRHLLEIGYVPAKIAAGLAPRMDEGESFIGKFLIKLIDDHGETFGLMIKINKEKEGSI